MAAQLVFLVQSSLVLEELYVSLILKLLDVIFQDRFWYKLPNGPGL